MRVLTVILFGLVAALPRHAAAQAFDGRMAYGFCAFDDFSQQYFCGTYLYAGSPEGRIPISGLGLDPALSPDGTRVAFAGLAVLNLSDWSLANLPGGWSPAWSPDGTRLAVSRVTSSSTELYVMNADGSNAVQLTTNVGFRGEPAWSRDGRTIAFDCEVEIGNFDICTINVDGTSFRRLTSHPGWDSGADYSPDRSSIVFATQQFNEAAQA